MTNLMPEIVPGRIKVKPRPYGITMMLDRCQGLNATKDLIHMAGEYLDQIKLSFVQLCWLVKPFCEIRLI